LRTQRTAACARRKNNARPIPIRRDIRWAATISRVAEGGNKAVRKGAECELGQRKGEEQSLGGFTSDKGEGQLTKKRGEKKK